MADYFLNNNGAPEMDPEAAEELIQESIDALFELSKKFNRLLNKSSDGDAPNEFCDTKNIQELNMEKISANILENKVEQNKKQKEQREEQKEHEEKSKEQKEKQIEQKEKQNRQKDEKVEVPLENKSEKNNQLINTKANFIINELINSETDYIKNLEYVLVNYENWLIQTIGELNTKRLLKNLFELTMGSKEFLKDLKRNQTPNDIETIAEQFIKHKSLFQKYMTYCGNQQSAEIVYQNSRDKIKEREIALNDKLGLHTGLLRPVQRLAKYEMLLKQLQRAQDQQDEQDEQVEHTERTVQNPRLNEALMLIQDVSQKSNNIVQLEQLLTPKLYQDKLKRSNSYLTRNKN